MHDGAQSRTGTREAALPPSKWAAAQSISEPPQNVLLSGTASVVWARGGTAVLSDKKSANGLNQSFVRARWNTYKAYFTRGPAFPSTTAHVTTVRSLQWAGALKSAVRASCDLG